MAVRRCCIENCKSCSTRKEDKGVTFHKFPKDVVIRKEWKSIIHYTERNKDLLLYVCSRHFCKGDFTKNEDSKYILKPDAVPSIFPWTLDSIKMNQSHLNESLTCSKGNEKNVSTSSKGSDTENLDAIKKFIKEQEIEIQEKKLDINKQHESHLEQGNDRQEENTNINDEIKGSQEKTDSDKKFFVELEILQEPQEQGRSTEKHEKHIEGNNLHCKELDKGNQKHKLDNIESGKDVKELEKVDNVEQHMDNVSFKETTVTEQIDVASSVMEFILSESEAKITNKMSDLNANSPKELLCEEKTDQKIANNNTNEKGNNSMLLSIGSRVEVKDFGGDWFPAEIAEVDYEEMEVLVRYDVESKKSDEWMSVSSSRLRPFTGIKPETAEPNLAETIDPETKKITTDSLPPTTTIQENLEPTKESTDSKEKVQDQIDENKEDIVKVEEKPKVLYEVGERCLARWRDNRRFMATINKDLGNGKYEVVFDDGYFWACSVNRLYKMKGDLTVETSLQPTTAGSPSPLGSGTVGPSSAPISPAIPVFHTHLFDPTRDYLCSKSERREKKRKLNIKEIFNIGQKKYKVQKTDKEKSPRTPGQKQKVVENNTPSKVPRVMIKKQITTELPDALASIIGTKEIKSEPVYDTLLKKEISDKSGFGSQQFVDEDSKTMEGIKEESYDIDDDDTEEPKSEGDSVYEEEVENLENFEVQDTKQHEAVIDRIKEAINKLEDGINEIEKGRNPKLERPIESLKLERPLTPKSERVLTPKPERTSTPKPERTSTPKLERALTPKLERALTPKPERAPTPKPERAPTPKLERAPTPKPERSPTPKPERAPTPKPERALTPKLERTLTPKPERAASPKSESVASNPETALTSKLERALSPNLDQFPTPTLENSDTPKPDIQSNVNLETPETTEGIKPQDLKDVLAEVVASIDINDSNLDKDDKDDKVVEKVAKSKKDPSRIKKSKKIRLLQEKKVKRQVAKVKSELEMMKRQFEEMRKQMMFHTQELAQGHDNAPLPESCLLPGEWCCKWVNGQPVGKVSEVEGPVQIGVDNKPVLPRRSVEVEDKRLPPGWTKHMVRRSLGHSAGKWDVVFVGPEETGNKRFHTKTDMRNFLEQSQDQGLKDYDHVLTDFGAHLKLSRRMGWIINTPDGVVEAPETILPAGTMSHVSPLVKRKNLNLKRRVDRGVMKPKKRKLMMNEKKRRPIKLKLQKGFHTYNSQLVDGEPSSDGPMDYTDTTSEPHLTPLEDGYVYVGVLKVQVIENLLRCPAESCYKNFRTKTLLQMHIKHYHRELIKMMGATPKVLDLAYARTMPNEADIPQADKKIIKVKITKPPKREEPKMPIQNYPELDMLMDSIPSMQMKREESLPTMRKIPRSLDSPKLRQALVHKPVKRPKVLLPVRRPDIEQIPDSMNDDVFENEIIEPVVEIPMLEQPLDFETAISTHTVTKPSEKKKKGDKKKSFASFSKNISEDEEWFAMNSDELDTRSSFPRSGSPDSKMDGKMAPVSSESNDDQKDANLYTYTETGERIKIVHMKREEIINCHCGYREEDGLMVQCELCLCWQHALCHNIQRECEVPDKYTCSICLNPRRGRRSQRFLHSQERMYEGLLPGGAPCPALRRAHELAGNLLRLDDALHALRVKYYVATKKDHPKLYLWACDWEKAEITYTQAKLNSDYSDLNIMINGMDKENLPERQPSVDIHSLPEPDPEDAESDLNMMINGMDKENLPVRPHSEEEMHLPPEEEQDPDRLSQRDGQLGSHALLSGLLSSPGGASLDFPISTSELERLAKSVQETAEWQRVPAPQPEAAIENGACRERLLKHITRCQALIDTRLDSIEAQVAELESQDPSFGEHYETAEFYPRTKQTIQMLMRDLDTMEELGVIT